MKTSDFDYKLPEESIAQQPLEPRDSSRMMVLDREGESIEHHRFYELPDYLKAGDVLVFNDSRVIPARLKAKKAETGGKVEILLLRRHAEGGWEALVKPGKRVQVGAKLELLVSPENDDKPVTAEVTAVGDGGIRVIRFSDERSLAALGEVPLPPYIKLPLEETERYQTVYSREEGSVAAPTAGLHFTPELLAKLEKKGVRCLFVSLHISLDTFRPVKEEDPRQHPVFREYGILSKEVAAELSLAKEEGRRVICVGTTAARMVEQAAIASRTKPVEPFKGWAELLILPGHKFRVLDGLITNFHLPRSTLLMLVSALAGREFVLKAYEQAVETGYRFYSFGDAMLIQ